MANGESELRDLYDRLSQSEKGLSSLSTDVDNIKSTVASIATGQIRIEQKLNDQSKVPWQTIIGFGGLAVVVLGVILGYPIADLRSDFEVSVGQRRERDTELANTFRREHDFLLSETRLERQKIIDSFGDVIKGRDDQFQALLNERDVLFRQRYDELASRITRIENWQDRP